MYRHAKIPLQLFVSWKFALCNILLYIHVLRFPYVGCVKAALLDVSQTRRRVKGWCSATGINV